MSLARALEVDRVALDDGEDERRECRRESACVGSSSHAADADAMGPDRGLGADTARRTRRLAVKQEPVMGIDAGDRDHVRIVGNDVRGGGIAIGVMCFAVHVNRVARYQHHVCTDRTGDPRRAVRGRRRRSRRALRRAICLRDDVSVRILERHRSGAIAIRDDDLAAVRVDLDCCLRDVLGDVGVALTRIGVRAVADGLNIHLLVSRLDRRIALTCNRRIDQHGGSPSGAIDHGRGHRSRRLGRLLRLLLGLALALRLLVRPNFGVAAELQNADSTLLGQNVPCRSTAVHHARERTTIETLTVRRDRLRTGSVVPAVRQVTLIGADLDGLRGLDSTGSDAEGVVQGTRRRVVVVAAEERLLRHDAVGADVVAARGLGRLSERTGREKRNQNERNSTHVLSPREASGQSRPRS